MERVIPFPCGEPVVAGGATHHHMLNAAIADGAVGQPAEQGGLAPGGGEIIEDGTTGANPAGFEVERGRAEHIPWQMHCRGVAHHNVAEGLLFQLGEHIQPSGTAEVVETVMVLQLQHLGAKHIGKGGAQHAAKGLEFLRQAADPEVDILQTPQGTSGIDSCCIQEVLGVEIACCRCADQGSGGGAPCRIRCCPNDCGVGAVSSDEVGEGFGMPDVQAEIVPARVGL